MDEQQKKLEQEFLQSERRHILMITNHGIHQWDVVSGLPDTGGQNIYVNQLTQVLADFGFRITILNRGGYPHPSTGELRTGFRYKDGAQRIFYLEDGLREFVRKEDMKDQIPGLVRFLKDRMNRETLRVDLIISNYWDAALLGVLYNRELPQRVPHLWIPHSLGAVKKRNMPPESWEDLRVDERIETEQTFMGDLDYVAATSSLIRSSLKEDYGRTEPLFLPPCINPEKYQPRRVPEDHEIWDFLDQRSPLAKEELRKQRIIIEISRTDRTKRKDVLLRAFRQLRQEHPDTLLIVALDSNSGEVYREIDGLIGELGLKDAVIPIGHEAERLPWLYAASALYCSPSVMEGFGMSVQEAAATGVPVVGSDKIPFVAEYLLGESPEQEKASGGGSFQVGDGGLLVPADDTAGFAGAMEWLLADEERRRAVGKRALDITVPYFTWEEMTRRLLQAMGVTP